MMNKIIITVLIAVDAILCLLCIWAFRIHKDYFFDEQKDGGMKTEILETCFVQGLNNDNLMLDNNLKVSDLDGKTSLLKEIIGDSVKLIVRFADTNCEECLRFLTVKLLRLTQENNWDRNNILFLALYDNSRNLGIIKNRLHMDFPVYLAENLLIPAESLNFPYCFTTDNAMRISHLFIPDKHQGNYSNTYFKLIHNRYFSHKNDSITN
jgi:hypothetical protein